MSAVSPAPSPRPEPVRDEDGYADLASYAAIGDGRTVALVARDGRVDWLPVPELDSPPLFAALLDAPDGGVVELAPDEPFTVERAYVEGTNVLTTTFTTASGSVRVTDSLDTGVAGRLPWLELSRRVDGLTGSVRLTGRIAPGTCFATLSPWAHDTVHGTVLRAGDVTLAPRTLHDAGVDVGPTSVTVRYETSAGSRHLLGLVATRDEPLLLPRPEDMDASVDRTVAQWRRWTDAVAYDGPWREEVTRSALLLKLLIYAPSGAVAAAATTSLPETTDGEGAWDYRHAWVRDVAYSLTALFRFGVREETHAAITWMLRTIGVDGDPAVVYRLDGRPTDREESVLHAPGWRGARVVAGNRAASQLQLGVFGDVFSIVQLYVDHGNVLDDRTGRALTGIADRAADLWRQPDSGMWELTELRHYTTSKLGCWQALTQAAHLADLGQLTGDADRWRHEADAIRAWVEEHCWDEEQGAYTWYPGRRVSTPRSSCTPSAASTGAPGCPRPSTRCAASLGTGPHLFRTSDHVGVEGAFVACGFWTVSALALCGRVDEAERLMDELVSVTPNDVGVLAEMVDPDTGAFLGNLPQGLSHLALVQAALTVDDARRA